ncbi:hypothetical protein MBRA1_001493 [Malassezia brasiliensis]|uniref:Conserved oligomeric Golgi complex subunit 5 helical domain-containing protein n=1 Tax=Malassezia brasiliensis TaxID=1821822 RepID=A0AAF0DU62_9BASI|nr:hypothetical protein MBRA1_001493 [Malassezia brasiliensis]
MDTKGSSSGLPTNRERRQFDKENVKNAHDLQVVRNDYAYLMQRAGIRGALVWGFVGFTGVFASHHIFPSFRRQTLAFKAFLTMSAASIGLVFAAETALQRFEYEKRTHDNLIRNRAMRELGQRGIVASEREIQKWQEELIQREIENRARSNVTSSLRRIEENQTRLEALQEKEELVSHAQEMAALCARLSSQMDTILGSDAISSAQDPKAMQQRASHILSTCITLEQLEKLLEPWENEDELDKQLREDCVQLDFLAPHFALLPVASQVLQEQVENTLLYGIRHLSPVLLGLALQAAEHRHQLAKLVENFIEDLNAVLLERIRSALDLYTIGKGIGKTQPPSFSFKALLSMHYRLPGRSMGAEDAQLLQQWSSGVWAQLHSLVVDEMAPIFTKINLLDL